MKQITETTILIETSKRFSIFTAALFKVTGFVAEKLLPHRLTRNIAIAVLPILISGCFSGISIDKITIENVKAQFWGSAPITDTLPSILTTPTTLPQLELTLTDYANNLAKTAQPTGTWTPVQSMTSTSTATSTPTPNNATATLTVIPVTAISTPIPGNEVQATLTAMAGGNTPEATYTVIPANTPTTAATASSTATFTAVPTLKATETGTQVPANTSTSTPTTINTPIATATIKVTDTGTPIATLTTVNTAGHNLKVFEMPSGKPILDKQIMLENLLCGEGTIGGQGIFFINDIDAAYVAKKAYELKANFDGTEAPEFVTKLQVSNPVFQIVGYLATEGGERIFLVNIGSKKIRVLIEESISTIPDLTTIPDSEKLEIMCVGTNTNGGGVVVFVMETIRGRFKTSLDTTAN